LEPEISYTPDYRDPSLLARIDISGKAVPTPAELRLLSTIDGGSYEPAQAFAAGLESLESAACEEGARFRFVENSFLREITASMLQLGDRLLYQKGEELEEFRTWLGSKGACAAELGDFVTWTVSADDLVDISSPSLNAFNAGAAMAVLCTKHDDERSWLNTGQALGRVHLVASALGMNLTVFNQPLQVPGVRARFARETGFCNFPQVVVRIATAASFEDANLQSQKQPCDCGCDGCEEKQNESAGRDR
jgi:hypothetical protein